MWNMHQRACTVVSSFPILHRCPVNLQLFAAVKDLDEVRHPLDDLLVILCRSLNTAAQKQDSEVSEHTSDLAESTQCRSLGVQHSGVQDCTIYNERSDMNKNREIIHNHNTVQEFFIVLTAQVFVPCIREMFFECAVSFLR